jgi:hypothetical protein
MRAPQWFLTAATVLLLAGSRAQAFGCYDSYWGPCYGADWYWSQALLCPWSVCSYGWGLPAGGAWCSPVYSFCHCSSCWLSTTNEVSLGGYEAVPYIKVAGARIGYIAGPIAR